MRNGIPALQKVQPFEAVRWIFFPDSIIFLQKNSRELFQTMKELKDYWKRRHNMISEPVDLPRKKHLLYSYLPDPTHLRTSSKFN